jgi:hypothetical protein
MKQLIIERAPRGFWNDAQSMLVLGEWCHLHSRRDRWLELEALLGSGERVRRAVVQ